MLPFTANFAKICNWYFIFLARLHFYLLLLSIAKNRKKKVILSRLITTLQKDNYSVTFSNRLVTFHAKSEQFASFLQKIE